MIGGSHQGASMVGQGMVGGGGSVLVTGAALRWPASTANTLVSSAHAQFASTDICTGTSTSNGASSGAAIGFARNNHHNSPNNHSRDHHQTNEENLVPPLPLSVRLAALGAACHTATLAVPTHPLVYLYSSNTPSQIIIIPFQHTLSYHYYTLQHISDTTRHTALPIMSQYTSHYAPTNASNLTILRYQHTFSYHYYILAIHF